LQHAFTFLRTWALWIEKTICNPLCDENEKSISDMLNDELDIDYDDEDLEIEIERYRNPKMKVCLQKRVSSNRNADE
jgi:hypothetical protein